MTKSYLYFRHSKKWNQVDINRKNYSGHQGYKQSEMLRTNLRHISWLEFPRHCQKVTRNRRYTHKDFASEITENKH